MTIDTRSLSAVLGRDKKTKQAGEFWDFLTQWWKGLAEDRGVRARLRRAKKSDDVYLSPDFQRGVVAGLAGRGIDLNAWEQERLALGVGILAHVRTLAPDTTFAKLLKPDESAPASVRDPRFRKLMAIPDDDPEALFLMLRRLVRYLGDAAEIKSLVTGAFWWNAHTRREWSIDYYTNRPAK